VPAERWNGQVTDIPQLGPCVAVQAFLQPLQAMLSIRPVSRNENSTVHRPKTPGRTLKNENTVRLPPATVNVKGKNVMQTPFQSKSTSKLLF